MKKGYAVIVTYAAHNDYDAGAVRAEIISQLAKPAELPLLDVSQPAEIRAPEIPEEDGF